jgi:hypothetical protein
MKYLAAFMVATTLLGTPAFAQSVCPNGMHLVTYTVIEERTGPPKMVPVPGKPGEFRMIPTTIRVPVTKTKWVCN